MSAIQLTGRLVCGDSDEVAIVVSHRRRHIELTRAEPGCVLFEIEPTGDPRVWKVWEVFVDQAAFDSHQARTRASDWGRATAAIERDYVVAVLRNTTPARVSRRDTAATPQKR